MVLINEEIHFLTMEMLCY